MCGRPRLSSDLSEIRLVLGIPPARPVLNFPPSWHTASADTFPVVRFDAKDCQRSLDVMRRRLGPFPDSNLRSYRPSCDIQASPIDVAKIQGFSPAAGRRGIALAPTGLRVRYSPPSFHPGKTQ